MFEFSVILLKGCGTSLSTCACLKEVNAAYLGFSVVAAKVDLDNLLKHMSANNTLPFKYKMVWENSAVVHCTYNTIQNMKVWFSNDSNPSVKFLIDAMEEECYTYIPELIKSAITLNKLFQD
jgi:hypothetical protein